MMKNKKVLLGIGGLLLAVVLMAAVYLAFAPKGTAYAKQITITIKNGESEKKEILHTEQAYLRGALEEKQLVAGEESQYGLFVKTVDGYTADDAKQEWWCFTKGGETLTTGVDATPIENGDAFEITLTTGY